MEDDDDGADGYEIDEQGKRQKKQAVQGDDCDMLGNGGAS